MNIGYARTGHSFPIPSDEQHEGDFGEFLHLGIDRAERVGIEVEDA